ncbi:unnamed protein product [Bathycoccus prasinos]
MVVFEAEAFPPPREHHDEDRPDDEEESSSFISRTTTKLAHDLSSIRLRALQSLHFKVKFNLVPLLEVTANDALLEILITNHALLLEDSEEGKQFSGGGGGEVNDGFDEDDKRSNSNSFKRSPVVAILTTVVRKSTKRELKIFQRTMRKIKGEATLRRIAADCKLIEGKEWMSEEIDAYFKAKRRAMVMQSLGNDDFSGGEDEDEDPSSSSRREAAAASSRESFNAKEEEIRRRLKRYENEELRTSTRSEQTVTVNKIPEVPRMVKCVSSDGSFGRKLVSRRRVRRRHIDANEEKKNEYDILRKRLTQYERTLKTTTNVDVLVGVLRALRENILNDWGVQAFALANPEGGIVRSACDILVSSSNSNSNSAAGDDVGAEDFLNLDRSVVSLKREALLFLADVALGLKSELYENRSDGLGLSATAIEIYDDDDVRFDYAVSTRRREVIFSQGGEHHAGRDGNDVMLDGDEKMYYYHSVHALPIAHAIAEAFIALARYPSLCGETCELFERCFLECDVLELASIDANTNGAHPSSLVRLKGYLRAWNVSGARSVGDSGANALCFITSEKLARFAKGFSVVVGKSKKKFNTIDDIYEDADEEEEGAILRVNDALIESCVEGLDQSDSHEDAHCLLDAMFIMRALGGGDCLLKSLASTRQSIAGIWERFLLVKPKTVKDTALWSRMLRLLCGCLSSSSISGADVEEKEHAIRFLAYAVAKVGAHACRRGLLDTKKSRAYDHNEMGENVDPNIVSKNTAVEDSRPVWLKHPIAIERELERSGDASGVRRLTFQEVLRDVCDCLEALLRVSSNASLNAVDVFAKSDEFAMTLSDALKNPKRSVEYGSLVACCDSIYALAAMTKRTSKRKMLHTDALCESCLPELLRVVERTATSIVTHFDKSRSSSIFDDACGGESLLESSLLAVIEVCENASSPSIWAEKFDANFENTSNILLSLVARTSSADSVASSKAPRCAALIFDLVAMLSAAFLDDSQNAAKAIASCQRVREIVFASTWFDCACLLAIDKSNASIARYRAAVCVAQILSSVAKDETSLFDAEVPSLDPGSNHNGGRVSIISLLSRRKLWITFARILEEPVGTDALVARGVSSAMVACARVDVVTAKESFSEFNMCLKNWLRPRKKKAATEGEVHMHRCAASANMSKLLGLFIVGERLNTDDYDSDYALKARPNSPLFYALFDVLKSAQSRGARAKLSAGELRAASSAALAIAAMLDGEYNNSLSAAADDGVKTNNLGEENARGELCEATCALLEMSLVTTSTVSSSSQGLFALIATMFSCERASRDALTFDPEDEDDGGDEMPPKTPPLIDIENDGHEETAANASNEGAHLPIGARLSRVLSRAFTPRITRGGIDVDYVKENDLYVTVASAFQNVLAHCASAKFEMIRSGSLELVLKRVLSENIDTGGIALCLRVLQHASFSAATFDEENDNEGEEALEEEHASSIKIREAAAMVKNATLLKYNGVLVFEKLFSLLFTPGRSTDSALTLSNRVKIELRDAYLAAVTNFILESDEFKRCICTASKNSGETSIFNRLVSFLFREKEKTTRLRDPLSFAEEKFIPSITMARGVKLLSSLSTFSLTRAQLSRSVFIEKCCEMIARFSISGTASTKNRSRVDLKIECDAAIDALCVLSGSDEDGAKLLLRSCKINIIGLLVDCYEHADNIFDETVHDENEIDDADDDEKDEDEATPPPSSSPNANSSFSSTTSPSPATSPKRTSARKRNLSTCSSRASKTVSTRNPLCSVPPLSSRSPDEALESSPRSAAATERNGCEDVRAVVDVVVANESSSATTNNNNDNNNKDSRGEGTEISFSSKERLFVATLDGSVSAVDSKTGQFLWSFETGSALVHASSSSSSSSSAKAKASGEGGEEESGDGKGGDIEGSASSSSVFPGLDGSLYVARRGVRGSSSAADIFSGGRKFSISRLPVTTRDLVEASPSVTNDGAVIVGTRKTTVFAVDAESGEIVRTFDPETDDFEDESSVRGNEDGEDGENGGRTIVLLGRTDYAVKSIDAVTGKVRWNVTHGDLRPVGGGGGGEGVGYIGGSDTSSGDKLRIGANNALTRVDESGNIVWTTRTSSMPLSVINERGENILGTTSDSGKSDEGSANKNNDSNEVTVGAHAGGYFALPKGGEVGDPVVDGSSGALVVPKYGESSALTSFVVGDNPTEDDWACMPMELKSIVEMQAEKGKIEQSLLPGGKVKDEENDTSFGSKVTFGQFSFIAMTGTLVVTASGTVLLKLLLQRQKVAKSSESADDANTNGGEQQEQQQTALTPSQKKKMKRKMKEQREKEMLEYAQNANETRSIIGFPEDGESSRSAMKVGRLIVKPTVLGYGSCGTVVFDGELDGRSVAVKRLLAQFHELARKELAALIASDEHPNILRCFAMEEDKDFVYVALERCETTLQARATETTKTSDSAPLLDTSGFPTSDGVRILRDVAAGLKQLHSQGIVHRDLKPSNILITEKGRGKLADMGVAKKVNLIDGTSFETRAILNNNNGGSAGGGGGDGTAGWQAPERLTNGRQSRAVDIFALGCVVHFVLTKGKHPFGEKFERDSRVLRGDYNVSALNHLPEAKDLVRKCLEANPEDRPSAREVLRHPAWWSREKRTQFLCDVSDRMELEDREPGERILLKTLERASKFAISNTDWRTKIDPAMLENLEKYRKYDGRSLRDLLRVIRNKSAHFRELPPRIQRILGEPPDAFYAYFASRFPNLLLAVHEFARKSTPIVNDQIFLKYFGDEEQLQEGNESWKDLKKLANDQKMKKESKSSSNTTTTNNNNTENNNENDNDDWDLPPQNFPVRPNAIDCEFYVKTGKCKYGETCKFNHPPGLHYRRV